MQKETMQQVRAAQRSEEFKRIMQTTILPFAKDFCAFVAINGFVAMLTVWFIATHN